MSALTKRPRIPPDVAENIIDQLSGDVHSLRSCALTCHTWHPRAWYHLVASIRIQSREDLFSVCDYFRSNPRVAAAVRSLSMSPSDVESNPLFLLLAVAVALLSRLPNLRSYSIRCSKFAPESKPLSFHATTFVRMKTYLLVEELRLGSLKFQSGGELARLLIALPRLRRFECVDLHLEDEIDLMANPTGMTQFRDKCRMLSEVTIWQHADVNTIRLIIQMSLSALQVLQYEVDIWIVHSEALTISGLA
ncbi:hypothetical protein C8T65DRAFT_698483 [Cerioporus squamosus]|nr:hypothetical protein C8T65DRAFT_698483 [Cerioporus squamosus]